MRWTGDFDIANHLVQTLSVMCWRDPVRWPLTDASAERLAGLVHWRALDWYRHEKRRRKREESWWNISGVKPPPQFSAE